MSENKFLHSSYILTFWFSCFNKGKMSRIMFLFKMDSGMDSGGKGSNFTLKYQKYLWKIPKLIISMGRNTWTKSLKLVQLYVRYSFLQSRFFLSPTSSNSIHFTCLPKGWIHSNLMHLVLYMYNETCKDSAVNKI